jgi:pimeloyl-ACP methyl ester carboxylesterase
LWPRAEQLGGPAKLIGADPSRKGAPATAYANQALGTENGSDFSIVEGAGHMLQIEKTEACIRLTMEFLAKCGLA